MKKTILRPLIFTIAAVIYITTLASCSDYLEQEKQSSEPVLTQVCSSEDVTISTGRLIRLDSGSDDTEYCYLELLIENNSSAAIAYSGVLCLKVTTADGALCPTENLLSGYDAAQASLPKIVALDGMIPSQSEKTGYIFFEAPKECKDFRISFATDFASGKWLDFSYSV